MNIVKNLKQHEGVTYLILTFLLTWLCWSISFASSNHIINGIFRITGSFMPSVVSIIYYVDSIR